MSVNLSIHRVKSISISRKNVRGDDNCPDHNRARMVISTEEGDVEITMYSGIDFDLEIIGERP